MDTLVIGLDGGEWDVIDPMIEAGELPNLAKLKEDGVSGPLESITPPVSPPAWNSINTGTNPGKHGIFDFSTFDEDYNRRSINSSDRRATPFWKVLNDHGVSTGLFKVPFVYPPSEVDGFVVSGFPTPNSVDDFAKPDSVAERVGPVENLFEDWSLQQSGDYEAFKENLIEVAERQTDLFIELIREYETDFSMTVYDGSDRVQHFFWKYFDESHPRYEPDSPLVGAIEEYYATVDRGIGRLLEEADEDCDVIVLSDHGFGPLSHDIYIDEWLEQEGILSRRSEDSASRITDEVLATALKMGWDGLKKANLDGAVESMLPETWFQFGSDLQNESHRDTVWVETKAFFTTLSGQAIYLNLEDRFSQATVPPEEYDEVIEEIQESLCSIRHPDTGEQLVEEVIRSDEVFSGWVVDSAPDLIVQTVSDCTMKGGRSDSLIQPSAQNAHDRSGDHRTDGIFIADGPSLAEGEITDASVLDIAPTLLYLQDTKVPSAMDGKALLDIFTISVASKRDVRETEKYGQAKGDGRQWNEDEEAELEKRLSDMGYLS
ncbi:type I phosphodiesterase/nucleotide pyrophosphatase [Haloferax volcanii DSM 14919]|uniref:Type I phosphodiesterase/nucleotide pyrophosphatase n=1 Tax=Haloferax lucentense (strain DSM 14919 / JCM 9276 / NCIMB 13854 / Aa 2.2) TaxID=1230452 RepID=M0GUT6_HALL2|nr:alkaline phosphatase family protein [Haloferax lucentense]ELZ75338.1 type I phosphodiesterase/nucleotide pyrophosphatase [Haloferax lucentense DSM 14919]